MAAMNPDELHNLCTKDLEAAVKAHSKRPANAKIDLVCSSVQHIRLEGDNTLQMVSDPAEKV